ncbi:hypothetical protein AJ80_02042 [Polytolypa hystricis UAMH7299]|uniref:precorrin-2 dehydrogenase n=1 Tax=Polytolypa hystricis (strain UAMH7299) TaxID=1447883 RepID=A0A2B7YS19_POLH7|nr:hypothetical protein AJ80_02042 [Polytolypa hystricis UAMH7299]
MPQDFPKVQPGGSLMVAWQVKNQRVLVVGGGEVAAGRILHALSADAKVTVVTPSTCLNEEVRHRISSGAVTTYLDRKFEPHDLDDDVDGAPVNMVFVAIDDPIASSEIWKLCKQRRIPANIADVPPECDFYFGSVHRDGPLQVMVSTNGNGPKMASIVRKEIARTLPGNMGAAISNVGMLRRKLRGVEGKAEEGPKRMKWISRVCESWSLSELVEMDNQDMNALLQHYAADEVPSFEGIRLITRAS